MALTALAVSGGTSLARADLRGPADTVTEIHYSFGDTPDSVWFDWRGQQQDIYLWPGIPPTGSRPSPVIRR